MLISPLPRQSYQSANPWVRSVVDTFFISNVVYDVIHPQRGVWVDYGDSVEGAVIHSEPHCPVLHGDKDNW